MNTQSLLVELLVEELPPKTLRQLDTSFAQLITEKLRQLDLLSANSTIQSFATPRRLAVHISQVLAQAPSKEQNIKLMPVKIALDANAQPTAALLKKMAALNIPNSEFINFCQVDDGKNLVLCYTTSLAGVTIRAGLQQAIDYAITKLPIPKVMSYQLADGWTNVHFVRPVHSIIALHGTQVLAIQALGLSAGNITQGHRFEASQADIQITSADSYVEQLRNQGKVIASYAERKQLILQQLNQAAASLDNLAFLPNEALLDEVNSLVERPNVLICQFDQQFLAAPQECLVLTMQANQKYFPLFDSQGKLSHKFLVVSNLTPANPALIVDGNERVVTPRLADAKFFFEQDKKHSLASRLDKLDKVVYHHQLGSLGERIRRVQFIAHRIAQLITADTDFAAAVSQAAQLSKSDLVTEMVGEFPELQGIMGRYYALNDGLSPEIAAAIEDHYKPRFAGDELPRNQIGICVALADKLETLVGMFGSANLPSGDKDPFALRRHALGVIRMLIERQLDFSFTELFTIAWQSLAAKLTQEQQATKLKLQDFFYDRLAGILKEQDYSSHEINAVLALRPDNFNAILAKISALHAFYQLPAAGALAEANKRVNNILKKNAAALTKALDFQPTLLTEPAEIELLQQLNQAKQRSEQLLASRDYQTQLKLLADLQPQVEAFFASVMVMCDDLAIRQQRLLLLKMLQDIMSQVGDLAKLTS